MMGTGPDLQPDELEAMQAEFGEEPVAKVEVTAIKSPVRTQDLPRKAGAPRTYAAVTTAGRRLLSADHRRALVRIVSIGQNMYVATTQAGLSDDATRALWPQNTVLNWTADTELWVSSATATTSISVLPEFWATGE